MVPRMSNAKTQTTIKNLHFIRSTSISSGFRIASTDDNTTCPVMGLSRVDDRIGNSGGDYGS